MIKDRTELMVLIRKNVSEKFNFHRYCEEFADAQLIGQAGYHLRTGKWWVCAAQAAAYCIRKEIGLTELMLRVEAIITGKGQRYASESTFLGNFLRIGRDMEMCPIKVCKLYAYKHIDFFREGEKQGNLPELLTPDGVLERCADIVLYSGLGYALDRLGE